MISREGLFDILGLDPHSQSLGLHEPMFANLARRHGGGRIDPVAICEERTRWFQESMLGMLDSVFGGCFRRLDDATLLPILVPSAYFHAETRVIDSVARIVFHEGLLAVLSFAAQLDVLVATIREKSPREEAKAVGREISSLGVDLFYLYQRRPFVLPVLRERFTEAMDRESLMLFGSAEMFVLLHEVGHIKLGHLSGEEPQPIARELPIGERLTFVKEQELEADAYALQRVSGDRTFMLLGGAMHYLTRLAYFQNFTGARAAAYPHAINRIDALVRLAGARRPGMADEMPELLVDMLEDHKAFDARYQDISRRYLSSLPVDAVVRDLSQLVDLAITAFVA
jgi:hypothetical protein